MKNKLKFVSLLCLVVMIVAACSAATPSTSFASVGDDVITREAYEESVRHFRFVLIAQYRQALQAASKVNGSPYLQDPYLNQMDELTAALDKTRVGQTVLNSMVNNLLIRQEAKRREITVSPVELDAYIHQQFGLYYPKDASTQSTTNPASTLSPTQIALLGPLADQSAPEPTPTSITEIDYMTQYSSYVSSLKTEAQVSEETMRYFFESSLYREKVQAALAADASIEDPQDQVWARHILFSDEASALKALDQLKSGANFAELAASLSLDLSTKAKGGDLGWFIRGTTLPEFEQAVFSMQIGQISDPIKTDSGYHLIQVLGHEIRQLSEIQYQIIRERIMKNWLDEAWKTTTIKIREDWQTVVPAVPAFTPIPLP